MTKTVQKPGTNFIRVGYIIARAIFLMCKFLGLTTFLHEYT